jgi:hypothetical protein
LLDYAFPLLENIIFPGCAVGECAAKHLQSPVALTRKEHSMDDGCRDAGLPLAIKYGLAVIKALGSDV